MADDEQRLCVADLPSGPQLDRLASRHGAIEPDQGPIRAVLRELTTDQLDARVDVLGRKAGARLIRSSMRKPKTNRMLPKSLWLFTQWPAVATTSGLTRKPEQKQPIGYETKGSFPQS